jgi:hypothetical protein
MFEFGLRGLCFHYRYIHAVVVYVVLSHMMILILPSRGKDGRLLDCLSLPLEKHNCCSRLFDVCIVR